MKLIVINTMSCIKVQVINCTSAGRRHLTWQKSTCKNLEDLADHNFNKTYQYEAAAFKKITFIAGISISPFSVLQPVRVSLNSVDETTSGISCSVLGAVF